MKFQTQVGLENKGKSGISLLALLNSYATKLRKMERDILFENIDVKFF